VSHTDIGDVGTPNLIGMIDDHFIQADTGTFYAPD